MKSRVVETLLISFLGKISLPSDSLMTALLLFILFLCSQITICMLDFSFPCWSFFSLIIFSFVLVLCILGLLLQFAFHKSDDIICCLQRQIYFFCYIFCFFSVLCISTFSIPMASISKSINAFVRMTKVFLMYFSCFCINSLFYIGFTSEAFMSFVKETLSKPCLALLLLLLLVTD